MQLFVLYVKKYTEYTYYILVYIPKKTKIEKNKNKIIARTHRQNGVRASALLSLTI